MKKELALQFLQMVNLEELPSTAYSERKRNIAMINMILEGYSYAEVAKMYGVSLERVRQIVIKAASYAKHKTNPFTVLPLRVFNAVRRGGYNTPEDFTNIRTSEILRIRNLGKRGAFYLISFLGQLDIPIIFDEIWFTPPAEEGGEA